MQIGDKFLIRDTVYTIWLIEGDIYHLISESGHGISGDAECIKRLSEPDKL